MTKGKKQNPASTTQTELQEYRKISNPETRSRKIIEAKHFYYPRTEVYKNKYLITNKVEFAKVYSRNTKEMMEKIRNKPLPERLDSSYLKDLHKQIFSQTFEWAGHTRDERFKFPNGAIASMPSLKKKNYTKPFANGEEIQSGLKKLDEMLLDMGTLQNLTREEFVDHTSKIMLHLYALNPFREGNRHVIQLFTEKLGQAAGHNLDYSLVSRKRKQLIRSEAVNNNNLEPITHLLEDISHPERVVILREFINNMQKLGLDQENYRPVVVAQDGQTYHGVFRGSGAEGFMIDVGGTFVVGNKKDLTPEQVKTLKIGDSVSFTAPLAQEVQKILIPKENVPDLTHEELSQRVHEDTLIKNIKKDLENLSEVVYGNKNALRNKLPKFKVPITNQEIELGEKFARSIEKSPQSTHRLRGVNVCGLKNSARQHAQENCLPLSHTVFRYIYALKQVENDISKSHSAAQKRCGTSVEMPSQQMTELFLLPKEQQQEMLSSSPELKTQIQTYFFKINERLSPSEHEAIKENDRIKLAASLGIPVSQAEKITKIFTQTKAISDIIRQQGREINKQKEYDVHQSATASGSEKSAIMRETATKELEVVKFSGQDKTEKEQHLQNRPKLMAL